jgi:hypothetical protein
METLKVQRGVFYPMSQQPDGQRNAREPLNEEEKAAIRAKATVYALLNRPSPPF